MDPEVMLSSWKLLMQAWVTHINCVMKAYQELSKL